VRCGKGHERQQPGFDESRKVSERNRRRKKKMKKKAKEKQLDEVCVCRIRESVLA
jgi:hypothetical protein